MLVADHTTLWQHRATTIRQLAALRVLRAHICGCARCNDDSRGTKLDEQIKAAAARVEDYSERLSQRSPQ
jgi:alkylhydroperoxidase family enzyme